MLAAQRRVIAETRIQLNFPEERALVEALIADMLGHGPLEAEDRISAGGNLHRLKVRDGAGLPVDLAAQEDAIVTRHSGLVVRVNGDCWSDRTDPFEPNEPILVCEPGPETRNLGRGRMGFRGVAGPSRDADHTRRLRSVGLTWRAHESARAIAA